MDFRLTEEQELLLGSLRELIAREFSEEEYKDCYINHKPYLKLERALVNGGFGTLGLPEEYGGVGADMLTQVLVCEEVARLTGTIPAVASSSVMCNMIFEVGTEEQKQLTLKSIEEMGFPPFCLGVTEPQAGSDNSALTTNVTRKNGKVYINGHKSFITDSLEAKYMLTLARDLNSTKPVYQSMSMWMVPLDAPGVTREPIKKIGTPNRSCCEIYLDNVELEEKDLVGEEGNAFYQQMKSFEQERLVVSACNVGMARAAYEDACRYANQRITFGKKIAERQLIQEKITMMAIKIENMRNMLYKCAWQYDNGISTRNLSALVKLYCGRAAFEVIDDAMQVLGGIGYTIDSRVARMWADVRLGRIGGGTDEIMIHIAGRGLLKEFAN